MSTTGSTKRMALAVGAAPPKRCWDMPSREGSLVVGRAVSLAGPDSTGVAGVAQFLRAPWPEPALLDPWWPRPPWLSGRLRPFALAECPSEPRRCRLAPSAVCVFFDPPLVCTFVARVVVAMPGVRLGSHLTGRLEAIRLGAIPTSG